MRHFAFLSTEDTDRLFVCAPQAFAADDDAEQLGIAMGATLYCPATRPTLAADILRRAGEGVVSTVICLEDAVADHDVAYAEANLVAQLRDLARSGADLPMIFVRVRSVEQIAMLIECLGDAPGALTGFVVPKFGRHNGGAYLDAVLHACTMVNHRLLMMPVLESSELGHIETRAEELVATRVLLDKFREYVPAVRVGATDLSAAYGLRRTRELTVWDLRVVADVLADVVNVFGRVETGAYAVAGPVWEYFPSSERMFKPQLRVSPFAAHEDRALRTKLIAADLDGLIREVVLDRANGLTGKTVIHPSHVAAVHALSVVEHEQYADALDVLATEGRGGAAASSFGNKMNESKPHTAWAIHTIRRARAFGVARDDVSFVDLLGAGLPQ